MTEATVAIIIPVRNRPQRVKPLVESIRAATPMPHRIVFVGSSDDRNELAAIKAEGLDPLVIRGPRQSGEWAKKINLATVHATEPLLFFGADDLVFHPDWLEAAMRRLRPGIGVVGTNDLGNPFVMAGDHATHMLVTREYAKLGTFDRPGIPVSESYDHNFCDMELVTTAKARGAWAFAADSIVEHIHPSWKKAENDATYQLGIRQFEADRKRWHQREVQLQRAAATWTTPALKAVPSTQLGRVTVITASVTARAALLAEAAASVAAQTVPCAHLVGVDDTRGVAEVRNALIAAASTEWVAFLDDDDLLDPNHLETLLAHSAGADVVIPYCRFDGPPLPEGFCNQPYDREVLRAHGAFPITVLARRQAVLDVGGFATIGWDDWRLFNAMADAGARFKTVPEVTWTYRTSTSDRRTNKLIAEGA